VDSIFSALFLERKILLNFLTYSKLLDECAKVSCLLLALLRQRITVIIRSDNPGNINATMNYDISDLQRVDSDKIAQEISRLNLTANDRNTILQLTRKNSLFTEQQAEYILNL
jgi:hypothetical protein